MQIIKKLYTPGIVKLWESPGRAGGLPFFNYTIFNGYIEEFRVVKGTAAWTTNFPTPSAAYDGATTPTPMPTSTMTIPSNARGQSTYYRPFLINREGDNVPSNRFFPIGYYCGISNATKTGLWNYGDDGSISGFINGVSDSVGNSYNDPYIYNSFFVKGWLEKRDKHTYACVDGCGLGHTEFPDLFSENRDYVAFHDVLENIYTTPTPGATRCNYYMIPAVIEKNQNTTPACRPTYASIYKNDSFVPVSAARKYNIYDMTCVTCTPIPPNNTLTPTATSCFPYSLDDQEDMLEELINTLKVEPRIKGWGYNEEFIAYAADESLTDDDAITLHQHPRLNDFKDIILTTDSSNHYPLYAVEPWTSFYDASSNSINYKAEYLDFLDYILDDGSYYTDFKYHWKGLYWANAVLMVEKFMEDDDLLNIGYCRVLTARDQRGYSYDVHASKEPELYRFIPYASWVCGGQGINIWSLSHTDTKKWFPLCHQMAREACAMQDYLMNGPASDIYAYLTVDSGNGDPDYARFILRRNQNNPSSNEFLLLFCYFGDQGGSHTIEVHFNHTITNVRQITTDFTWYYDLQAGNQVFFYDPDEDDTFDLGGGIPEQKKDVYARAFFVTLN